MIYYGVILVWNCIEHSQLPKHVHHEIQESLARSPLQNSTQQSEGVSGVQESGAYNAAKALVLLIKTLSELFLHGNSLTRFENERIILKKIE